MGGRIRNIEVTFRNQHGSKVSQHFVDWYEVADWLKQEVLAGREVTITYWKYDDFRN